jgi:hypothetical protein
MVRDRLGISVYWVERMARERSRDQPLVVRLVQMLVQERVVQDAMNPVHKVICEDQEAGGMIGSTMTRPV